MPASSGAPTGNARPTALYIDDDPSIPDAVGLLLESEGWRSAGADALIDTLRRLRGA